MGNVMFIAGVTCIIGFSSAFRFFFGSPDKIKGTSFFFGGVFCVLFFSPLLGMLVELVGLYYLFSGFLPMILGFLRRVPVINVVFSVPVVSRLADSIGKSKLPV